jgi:F0F1-type ATP synthase assembly protein I
MDDDKKKDNLNSYMVYTTYGIELAVAVGLGLWLGYYIDKKTGVKFPLLTWILPLILLVAMLVQIVREFSGKQK